MRNMKISILALIAHVCRCRKNLWKKICDDLEMSVVVVELEYVGGGGRGDWWGYPEGATMRTFLIKVSGVMGTLA